MLQALETGGAATRRRLTPVMVVGVLAVLGAGIRVVGNLRPGARVQWARAEAIPQIRALADSANVEGARSLAQQVQSALPNDPMLVPVWPRISRIVNLRTDPPARG